MKPIDKPADPGTDSLGGLVEIYVTSDPIEAAAVTGLLESVGLDARIRDMAVTPYPLTIGPLSEKRIMVPARQADEARVVLRRAEEDGILDPRRTGVAEDG